MRRWLSRQPAGALDEWWAYYQVEPWDVPREFWPDVRRETGDRSRGRPPASHGSSPVRWVSARQAAAQFARLYAPRK